MAHPNEPPRNTKNANPQQQPTTRSTEIPPGRAAYLSEQYGYTPEQINVVRRAICVGATDEELEFFLATCKRVALDPFARQIWFVKRRQKIEDSQGNEQWIDVGRPETSIDGLRTIAERTGEYRGQSPMLWCGPDGKWTEVWLKSDAPTAAKATIHREGFKEPMQSVALFTEFCPTYKNAGIPSMWKKMGANQLAKCAEAAGFRKAFPRDLSGMVTDTEMEHVAATGASYTAPTIAAPKQPQLDARKPDRASEIVDMPRDTTVQGDGSRAGFGGGGGSGGGVTVVHAKTTAAKTVDERKTMDERTINDQPFGLPEEVDELDREMVRLLKIVDAATSRDGLQEVGKIITAAQDRLRANPDGDAYSSAVVDVVKPALEKKWRELAKSAKAAK